MLIRDLVHLNSDGEFATVIDLGAFRKPRQNHHLCESFCFAKMADGNLLGSYNWLNKIRKGLAEGNRNVWSLTANYGHGKTHFGVVLANYFGQPWGSPELQTIEEHLSRVEGKDMAKQCMAWRERRPKPYFTLCLQGQHMPSLRTAVFVEVEEELKRHKDELSKYPALANYKPPVWHRRALEILDQLDAEQRSRAEAWAERHGRDLGDLRQRLEHRDTTAELRDLYEEMILEATKGLGAMLDADVTLRVLIDTIYKDLCYPDGPFSGIAVVFDEFHHFVAKMTRQKEVESFGAFVEPLLDPERVKAGTSFLIVMGTMDPDDVARQRMGNLDPDNPVAKELNRIPAAGIARFELRSELETILDTLLEQLPEQWPSFESAMKERLRDASTVAYPTFKHSFGTRFSGGFQQFHEEVTKGAYPLHPIATELLSNLKFEVVQSPRGVLEFVKEKYAEVANKEAEVAGHPNWVLASSIYDPFKHMLKQKVRDAVEAATDSLGGDASAQQKQVIEAMALITAASLPTPHVEMGGYGRLVAEITGMQLDNAQETLQSLEDGGIVDYDKATGRYRFPEGANRARFRSALQSARSKVKFSTYSAQELTKKLANAAPEFVRPGAVHIDWGADIDWSFRRVVATREQLLDGLKGAVPSFNEALETSGTKGWSRAVEVLYLPLSVEDVEWIRAEGPELIRSAFPGIECPPVYISSAIQPAVGIEAALTDVLAAEAISDNEIHELQGQYLHGLNRLKEDLQTACAKYLKEPKDRITSPNAKAVQELHEKESDEAFRLGLLKAAYNRSPLKFSDSSLSSNPHTAACARLATPLLTNSMANWAALEGNGPARIIAELYLRDAWGMVSPDWVLKTPSADQRVGDIWKELQEAFPAGTMRSLGEVLRRLANPPFGLDTCSLTLIVSGWLGYQGTQLSLTLDGKPTKLANLSGNLATVFGNLLRLRIKREDIPERNRRAQKIISEVEAGSVMTRVDANEAIVILELYANDPSEGWEERIESAVTKLKTDRDTAKRFSEIVAALEYKTVDTGKFLDLLKEVTQVELGVIRESEWPTPAELHGKLAARLLSSWNVGGDAFADIKDVTFYPQRRATLVDWVTKAKACGVHAVAERIEKTIKRLDQRKKELETVQQQKGFQFVLKQFKPKKENLLDLRQAKKDFATAAGEIGSLNSETQELYDQKSAEIDTEIEELVRKRDLTEELDAAGSLKAVQTIQKNLERLAERLEQTPELRALEEHVDRVSGIARLFEELDTLLSQIPEKRKDLAKSISRATKLSEGSLLPKGLREYAERVVSRLEEEEQRKTKRDDKEFAKQEKLLESPRVKASELERLLDFFTSPPEFVSQESLDRAPAILEVVEAKLAVRSAERIRDLACKLKGEKQILLDLANYLRLLADES